MTGGSSSSRDAIRRRHSTQHSTLLGPGGAAAEVLPGYEARAGQLAMAERIADAIDGDERLLVEAGTGTGKTLAYLVPALLSGRKIVVSTGTKTLQDQIATVDLPRLRTIFAAAGIGDENLDWAVMKGLGNYVCRRRLAERERQQSLVADPDFERLLAFAASSATGDRAELARACRRGAALGRGRRHARDAHRPALRLLRELLRDRDAPPRRRRAAGDRQPPPLLRRSRAARAAGPRRRCCPPTRWSSSTRPTRSRTWRRSSSASTPRRSGCSRWPATSGARPASRPRARESASGA